MPSAMTEDSLGVHCNKSRGDPPLLAFTGLFIRSWGARADVRPITACTTQQARDQGPSKEITERD